MRSDGERWRLLARGGLMCGALAWVACAPEVAIGIEHQVTVTAAAFDPATGELLEAGYQHGRASDDGHADLWFGRARADGTLVTAVSIDHAGGADAVLAAVTLPAGGAVLAGFVSENDGTTVAWVRALDGADAERWTLLLPQAAGTTATALAVDPEGGVVVGGLERQADGSLESWLARIADDGTLRWRKSVLTAYPGSSHAFQLEALTAVGPSFNRIYAVGARPIGGVLVPAFMHFTLAGDLYNSAPFDAQEGVARGIYTEPDNQELTACIEAGGAVSVVRVRGYDVLERRRVSVSAEGATLVLGGCTTADNLDVMLAATAVYPDGRRVPKVARVDRQANGLVSDRDVSVGEPTSAQGLALKADGTGAVFGRVEPKLRRWAVSLP